MWCFKNCSPWRDCSLANQDLLAAQAEIAELKEGLKNAEIGGIMWCIKVLRSLQEEYRHESKWNHSASTKFAPVELSDYILRKLKTDRKTI